MYEEYLEKLNEEGIIRNRKEGTIQTYTANVNKFLNWANKNPEELLGCNTKKKSKRKSVKTLPVVVDTYELSNEEQVCPKCGSPLHEMKENVRVEIEVILAKVQVHKHISKVYACRNCEKEGTSTIITAPGAPAPVIPGSIASSSVIADSIAKKYVDATPFYRQEKNNERAGIPIIRNNYCNWSIKVANIYFSHLEKRMREIMYKEGVIHCDETYTEVLLEPDRPATRKSYIWVTTTAEYQKEQLNHSLSEERTLCFQTHLQEQMQAAYCMA